MKRVNGQFFWYKLPRGQTCGREVMWDFEWWRHPPTKDGVLPIGIWAVTFAALWLLGMDFVHAGLYAVGAMLATSVVVMVIRRFTQDR